MMEQLSAFMFKIKNLVLVAMFFSVALAQGFQPPSDVRNVVATPKDGAVELSWDPATDPDGVVVRYKVYYGVTAVTEEGGAYDQEIDTQSDNNSFEVTNLINNDTYYFGVTAVDEQGNESELYSVEVSATPTASTSGGSGGSASGAPILQSATHIAPNRILVVMSEPVRLANPREEAYELTEDSTGNEIQILNALIDSEEITLIVDPASLTVDEDYLVTATTGVTDFDDNPVSSGIVDSVQFTALEVFAAIEEDEPGEEEEEETLLEEEPEVEPEPLLIEDEPAGEPITPDDFGIFFLDSNDTNSETADFLDQLLAPENPINNLDDTPSEPSLADQFPLGDPLAPAESVLNQTPDLSAAPDQKPPQDARNLSADTSNFQSGSVVVSWTPALDLDSDIKDQILYTRVGLGAWDQGLSLGKDVSQTTITVEPNQNYQVRLVTVDNAGNESFGAAFEFSTTLTQSGGGQGTVIALSIIAVLGFMMLFAGGRRA